MKPVILMVGLLVAGSASAHDYADLIGRAFANINDTFHETWAFTETKIEGDMTLVGRYDPTLPASHLVESLITTPPDFPGTGIRSVPRLVLKPTENERGAPLIGAAAKVAEGFFWIALSAAEADVKRNLELLRESPWIDLPMVYENGQRAILTFEKGPQGTEVFENAFAAWSTG